MNRTATIVTVGSELVEGLRVDTNTAEIARSLAPRGFRVIEAVSVPDSIDAVAETIARCAARSDLVITTGGLGPTHDDVTREAAATALGLPLVRDDRLVELLQPFVARHVEPDATEQLLRQADVLEGARVIDPTTGTAPGLVITTGSSIVALLPGPPTEMRPMLDELLQRYPMTRAGVVELGVVGLSESDAQVRALAALRRRDDVGLTVLASPGDVRILLFDRGAGPDGLARAQETVAAALGAHCYTSTGESLAEATVRLLSRSGCSIAVAESCTGGMVAAALTDVAGSSAVFLGGVVAYANEAKVSLLDVPSGLLAQHGAVSEECARAMAEGVRARFCADVAVSTTGIAGPSGGTADKPVGTVWFGVADADGSSALMRTFPGSRSAVRARATATALDVVRRHPCRR